MLTYTRRGAHSFARTTAVLDQMGLNVVDARLITSANGFSLETYVVLEDNGAVIADSRPIREIERGLWRILQQPRGFAVDRDAARAAPGAHVLDAAPRSISASTRATTAPFSS